MVPLIYLWWLPCKHQSLSKRSPNGNRPINRHLNDLFLQDFIQSSWEMDFQLASIIQENLCYSEYKFSSSCILWRSEGRCSLESCEYLTKLRTETAELGFPVSLTIGPYHWLGHCSPCKMHPCFQVLSNFDFNALAWFHSRKLYLFRASTQKKNPLLFRINQFAFEDPNFKLILTL